jgi:hypothetical protein
MDKTSHHFYQSVFNKMKNRVWWNPSESWRLKYVDGIKENGRVKWNVLGFTFNKPVQITDAWHFFKTLMIIFTATSISLLTLSPVLYIELNGTWIDYVCNFIGQLTILGILWNKTFSIFYDKIWVKK